MKKYLMGILMCYMLTIFLSVPVYAGRYEWIKDADVLTMQRKMITTDNNASKVKGIARGRLISSVGLEISSDGNGMIGVYAETLCHIPVKNIYSLIYLEVWDESKQDWKYVNEYEYEWKSSDFPNEELTNVSISFDVDKLQRGKTYSLRGYYTVEGFDYARESMSIETDGLLLE